MHVDGLPTKYVQIHEKYYIEYRNQAFHSERISFVKTVLEYLGHVATKPYFQHAIDVVEKQYSCRMSLHFGAGPRHPKEEMSRMTIVKLRIVCNEVDVRSIMSHPSLDRFKHMCDFAPTKEREE